MKYCFLLLVLTSPCFLFSQSQITMEGSRIYQDGKKLKIEELLKIVETNEEASDYVKAARSNLGFAKALAFTGGFAVGWTLGDVVTDGEPNWELAAAGFGLFLVSLPLAARAGNDLSKATNIYNDSIEISPKIGQNHSNLSYGLSLTFSF